MLAISRIKINAPWPGHVLYIKVTGQDLKHITEINEQLQGGSF